MWKKDWKKIQGHNAHRTRWYINCQQQQQKKT